MHVNDKSNSHQYDMIMYQVLVQELGLDIEFSYCTIRGESPVPAEGYYTPMKGLKS